MNYKTWTKLETLLPTHQPQTDPSLINQTPLIPTPSSAEFLATEDAPYFAPTLIDWSLINQTPLTSNTVLFDEHETIDDTSQNSTALPPEELDRHFTDAQMYYFRITESGVKYGQYGKDMLSAGGFFGQIAKEYFLQHVGGQSESNDLLFTRVQIALANKDRELREENPGLSYADIAQYHRDVYNEFGVTPKAWFGTFFEDHFGAGTWMKIGYYDTVHFTINSPEFASTSEYQTLIDAHSKLSSDMTNAPGIEKLIECADYFEHAPADYMNGPLHAELCGFNDYLSYTDSMFM